MANFNFSADITDVVDYVEIKESRYIPVDAEIFVQDILSEGFPYELNFDINNNPNNIINLSYELFNYTFQK
jgi:hypothetical protein